MGTFIDSGMVDMIEIVNRARKTLEISVQVSDAVIEWRDHYFSGNRARASGTTILKRRMMSTATCRFYPATSPDSLVAEATAP